MIVGCPTEIKTLENRVGMVPAGASALIADGHRVLIQKGAGLGSGITDDAYTAVGAEIVETADDVWAQADMIVKVKEPLPAEYERMREGQLLYTYLHLAAASELTDELLKRGVNSVAYETIEKDGRLPLLKPMSEVAGKMATQVGAWCLEKHQGGKGMLLGGVPGTPKARVTVIGGGVVGTNAAKIAVGMGADVTILDLNLDRLEYLDDVFLGRVHTLYAAPHTVREAVLNSDLIVGAILIPGAKAKKLVTRDMLKDMEDGTVIVDVAVDQGGCVETTHPTTHDDPTFVVDGVVHYGVANMPGAVSRTSTYALTNATLPYMRELANKGIKGAIEGDAGFALGVNTYAGKLTCQPVADSLGLEYTPLADVL